MVERSIFILECTHPACNFRTTLLTVKENTVCPACGSPVRIEKRTYSAPPSAKKPFKTCVNLTVVLDNIRSVLNVGSIFRTADAVGVDQIYLCGITPTPKHPRLAKTSLGAEWSIGWQYSSNVLTTINELKRSGKTIICLEETLHSKSIFEMNTKVHLQSIALVVGNEVTGVDPAVLEICDQIVDIPMLGYKRSLNVAVAFGIAVYQIRKPTPGK